MPDTTILIIDDEKFYLDVLHEILHREYRILVAKTGEQGLQRLQGDQLPDLILLDVLMPGIDGYETCRRIKQNPRSADIPVVFLTARDDVEAESHGFSLGAVDYITKPISPPVVCARIRTHLALRRAQLALQNQNQHLESMVKQRTATLRKLSAELVLVEERERRRIASELHDGPAQRLALSKMNLGRLRNSLGYESQPTLEDIFLNLNLTLQELRTLMVQLSPPALYELGLGPAVEWLAESILGKQGITYRVDSAETYADLPEETRVFLFQAIRELLINIVKHASAARASVSINTHDGDLVIEILDDGIGMQKPPDKTPNLERGGFGLFALRDRIDMLGGQIYISVSNGTHVTLQVPLSRKEQQT
jgi:two-component system, sensor histidine kinase and response regulator